MAEKTLSVKPMINPLTEHDRAAIEAVLARLPEIQDLLDRAEACGINLGDRRDRHDMHAAIAQRLHTHFFPRELPAVQD